MNPSIFNDVIGPVMRGPSSSHCAAALRLGRLAWDLLEGDIEHVLIQLDRQGSLATTHESQGSDMGLFAGLLGWEATAERLPAAARTIRAGGVQVEIEIGAFGFDHPNTYRIELCNRHRRHVLTGISTGGGMIEVMVLDGTAITILGPQCGQFQARLQAGGLREAGLLNSIIRNVTALMEVKSAMGVIVAAPTAGACAALPGTCLAAAALGVGDEEAARAMLAGGLIGVLGPEGDLAYLRPVPSLPAALHYRLISDGRFAVDGTIVALPSGALVAVAVDQQRQPAGPGWRCDGMGGLDVEIDVLRVACYLGSNEVVSPGSVLVETLAIATVVTLSQRSTASRP
jgi:iron-sulfur-dependent L-serine dehydratase beta subunit